MKRPIGFNQEDKISEPEKMEEGEIGNNRLGGRRAGKLSIKETNLQRKNFDLRLLKTIELHMLEREKILENINFTEKLKLKYLENNRKSLIISTGGYILKTESIAWGLLISTSLITISLAILTALTSFPVEIFLGISGPLFGGTLVAIANKLTWK